MSTCKFCGRKKCVTDIDGLCRSCALEHAAYCDKGSGALDFLVGVTIGVLVAAGAALLVYAITEVIA